MPGSTVTDAGFDESHRPKCTLYPLACAPAGNVYVIENGVENPSFVNAYESWVVLFT